MNPEKPNPNNKITLIVKSLEKQIKELKKLILEIEKQAGTDESKAEYKEGLTFFQEDLKDQGGYK